MLWSYHKSCLLSFSLFYFSTLCSSALSVFCEALNPAAMDNTPIKEAAVPKYNRTLLFILSSNKSFFLFPKVRHAAFCFRLVVQVLPFYAGMSYQTQCHWLIYALQLFVCNVQTWSGAFKNAGVRYTHRARSFKSNTETFSIITGAHNSSGQPGHVATNLVTKINVSILKSIESKSHQYGANKRWQKQMCALNIILIFCIRHVSTVPMHSE